MTLTVPVGDVASDDAAGQRNGTAGMQLHRSAVESHDVGAKQADLIDPAGIDLRLRDAGQSEGAVRRDLVVSQVGRLHGDEVLRYKHLARLVEAEWQVGESGQVGGVGTQVERAACRPCATGMRGKGPVERDAGERTGDQRSANC